jgi:hypothetical protein
MTAVKKVAAGAALGVAVPAAVGVARKLRRKAAPRGGSSDSGDPTKEELYEEAKRLKIEGRSSMTKAQLKQAISRARS